MGRTVLVAVDEAVARTVRDRLRSDATDWAHEVTDDGSPAAVPEFLRALDRQLDAHDGPQDLDDVEFGVCHAGALWEGGVTADPADAFITALRLYRAGRAEMSDTEPPRPMGDDAEPIQILVWPREQPDSVASADVVVDRGEHAVTVETPTGERRERPAEEHPVPVPGEPLRMSPEQDAALAFLSDRYGDCRIQRWDGDAVWLEAAADFDDVQRGVDEVRARWCVSRRGTVSVAWDPDYVLNDWIPHLAALFASTLPES